MDDMHLKSKGFKKIFQRRHLMFLSSIWNIFKTTKLGTHRTNNLQVFKSSDKS